MTTGCTQSLHFKCSIYREAGAPPLDVSKLHVGERRSGNHIVCLLTPISFYHFMNVFLTLLACKSILVCTDHRPVAQYHQCTMYGTDYTVHTFDVRLKQVYKSRWRD